MKKKLFILGAGITGLSAGVNTGVNVYEANALPGGICSSYYIDLEGRKSYSRENLETYRFEKGGGHWIFGADDITLNFIDRFSLVKKYKRKSAVYFPNLELYVPFPLQNHLSYLPKGIAKKALDEIIHSNHNKSVSTLSDWLELHFGKTLCEFFFFPFHELYTAGLFIKIAPQDKYKTPINKEYILRGFKDKTPPVGYNTSFFYPSEGLNGVIRKMTKFCRVNYNKRVTTMNIKRREILFSDGSGFKFDSVISTIPLNMIIEKSNINIDRPAPPYTSVLVVNIGAKRGEKCPDYHWLYIPHTKSGFHRVGF